MSALNDETPTSGVPHAALRAPLETELTAKSVTISTDNIRHGEAKSQSGGQSLTICDTVVNQPQGQWLSILADLAPVLVPAMTRPGHKRISCPVHGGRDGFRFFKDANDTGGGVCNTCGLMGSGFKVLAWINGWRYDQARDAVRDYLNPGHGATRLPATTVSAPASPAKPVNYAKRQAKAQSMLAECVDLLHPDAEPVRRYLTRRGLGEILQDPPDNLLCHPGMQYWEGLTLTGYYPAMVGVVKNSAGELVSLHRTYLTPDGDKAAVDCPKKITPACMPDGLRGATIPLYPTLGDVVAVGEGLETMLAVRLATGLPVQSCVTAWGLSTYNPPPGVRQVLIMADLDRSEKGQAEGQKLDRRLIGQGVDARLILPDVALSDGEKSMDWLDIFDQWQRQAGREEV